MVVKEVNAFLYDNRKAIFIIFIVILIWKIILPKIINRLRVEQEIQNVRAGKFNPNPIADGLHSEIDSYWGDIAPFQQFNSLDIEQQTKVAEAYNRRHGNKLGTIRVALQNAQYPFSPNVSAERDKAVQTLITIGY